MEVELVKLRQHISIGKKVLESDIIDTFKVNKAAYLIGNIAPDLNCIYPAHRLKSTEKRFYRRLRKMDSSCSPIIKSFVLGVITHYICDYFCFAHNNKSLGALHRKYESNLYEYYNAHFDEMDCSFDRMMNAWLLFKDKSRHKYEVDSTLDSKAHCEFIIEQVKDMNKLYLNGVSLNNKGRNWTVDVSQMSKDIKYSYFMIINTLPLILEPFKCLIDNFERKQVAAYS